MNDFYSILLDLTQFMRERLLYSLLTLFMFFSGIISAQTGKFYSTDKDLSNSLINQVYQDHKGFVWIATENGLNVFNGTRFSIYRHEATNPHSLKNDYVRTLFEDSEGRFWIGCINGLQLYDRATDSFSEVDFQREDGRNTPHITSIVERKNGDIWIATSGQGAISLKKGLPTSLFKVESELTEQINSIYLNYLFEDSNGSLWIATEDKGLFCFSPEKNTLKRFYAPENIGRDDVSVITEDQYGTFFVGTLTGGLYMLKREDKKFRQIPYKNNTTLNIRTLLFNKQGRLLIGTDGEGLKEYDPAIGEIVDSNMHSTPIDYSKAKIHTIVEDKDLNLWLGIFQKGIVMLPGNLPRFDYYGPKSIYKNTIGSSCVMTIFTDRDNITWVGTDNDGVYAINEKGERIRHFSHKPGNPNSVPSTIMYIYEDSMGKLWIGSYLSGLLQMDKKSGECRNFTPLFQQDSKRVQPKVSYITEDRNKNLWVGTYGTGMYQISPDRQHVTYYESTRDEKDDWQVNRLHNDWISCILEDSEGILWIGTYKGLASFNAKTKDFIFFDNSNNLLPGYVVYTLLETKDKNLWVGTTEGLLRLDRQRKITAHYTIRNGLSSNVICALSEDDNGNLWISTHQGISRLDPKEGRVVNYHAGDGVQGNEFTRNAVFKNKEGRMYFGGPNGITSFYPDEILEQRKELQVMITDFYLANHAVKKGDRSGGNLITDTTIMDSRHFTIAYNENTFSLEFSVLEYCHPERIGYQYRIKELGNEWVSTQTGTNRVTFSNLKPGKYSFSVRAYSHNYFSDIRTVNITITPPWYQTWWAYLIWNLLGCLVLFAIVMYIISRIRHKQDRIRQEHQEQISEAKLQFFINISHEIRTPMTLVIGPLEKLLSENSDKHPTYLLMYRNAQRILQLINQLMDIRKLDKGQMHLKFRETDIVGFIDDLVQTFEYQAQHKEISFTFEKELSTSAEKELKVWIDLSNLDKVLLNLLSNAFKFTPKKGSITVKLTTGQDEQCTGPLRDYFEITVTDSGIGIEKDKIEQIFERFYQINNDITQSNFGTGIGLHLSRLLVKLHHGTLQAENIEVGTGSRFIVRLPLSNAHLKPEELEIPQTNIDETTTPPYAEKPKEFQEKAAIGKRIKAKTQYRILVVEDNEDILEYISNELSSDFHIHKCTNGLDALEYVLKNKPDLVISDIMMSKMDGITLCRKIKLNTNINHTPVILLTAKSKPEDRIEGLEIGADSYIVKPFSAELLRTTIYNLIENRERIKNKFVKEKQIEEQMTKIEMKSSDEILIEKVMKTINERLSDPSLNVEMLAAHVGMSRVHMHRKLKELTNQSARDFIRGIRLKQAGRLLSEKKLTISEVAYATGFTNLSLFSNSFKDFYGVTPSEYRGGEG